MLRPVSIRSWRCAARLPPERSGPVTIETSPTPSIAPSTPPAVAAVIELDLTERPWNPSQLHRPAFLLNVPFSFSTGVANNAWMVDLDPADRVPNHTRAMSQFWELYSYVSADAVVYLIPTPRDCGLQDLVFTGNLGIVPEHVQARDTVVVSNFTSNPRRGEADVGVRFFEEMGYRVLVPPAKFEGEADLKHLHDNVYAGGHGLRSQRATYQWMARTLDMKIVELELTDPYLYHLDCTVFPLTVEQTLVCTEMYEEDELGALEAETGIIDVSVDDAYQGICNSVRLGNVILNASNIHELRRGTEDYTLEARKNHRLEEIAAEHAFEVAYFNLSEYMKGGALLSCMVMHLNRYSYAFRLV
jgi:N-dimethylarginine dimethylaminohydrolase